MAYTEVSDISPLTSLVNLEYLDLTGTPVSDVSPLAEMKTLRTLNLQDTEVDPAECEALRKELPNTVLGCPE